MDEIRHHPLASRTMAETAEWLINNATWSDRVGNRYGMTREQLAFWLRIKHERNARKRIKELRDAGWIVLCIPGHNGQQQVFHRSVPWNPVRYWPVSKARPLTCPHCGWRYCARDGEPK